MTAARGLVPRWALFDRLSEAESGEVILVCAPAGSGKTVLVRSWLASERSPERAAWVSVERGERDAQRFWLSVIDELARATKESGLVERVAATPAFGGEAVVERLVSDLRSLAEPVVLVIDDLHELHSGEALRLVEHFVALWPPTVELLITTREDPGLGLHRLRVDGRLTEILADELRFSLEETCELLQTSGVALSEAGTALLYKRTEGWAAGLRLAALSLARHPDPERFVAEFSGSERTVAGYLLAEVLDGQPPDVRDLLLRTSVLERVSGSLADALTGRTGSEAILQGLEDANAFVTSLDAARSWFRYHHLLADMLRRELRRSAPTIVDSLHSTAAAWHEAHGDVVEAVRHAQAAGDTAHAARLLADSYVDLVFDGRKATLRGLLAAFPSHAAEADPELALAFATGRLYDARVAEAAAHLAVAERLAHTIPGDRRRLFDLRLASARLWLASQRGDLSSAKRTSVSFDPRTADEVARGNDHRASALLNVGIAELWALHLDEATRDLEEALALSRRIERPYLEVGSLGYLALTDVLAGLPTTGLRLSEEAVTIAEEHGWGTHRILAAAVAAAAGGLTWLGRFDEAVWWLDRFDGAQAAEELETEPLVHYARAFVRVAQDRPAEALSEFRAAQRMQPVPARENALPVDIRGWIVLSQALTGDAAATRAALAAVDPADDDLAGVQLARAALALDEDDPEAALEAVEPLLEGTPRALHPGWATIHALLFDAVARDRLGDCSGSAAAVERALELAEADGVVLPFVLVPLGDLLERHPRHGTSHGALLARILDVRAGSAAGPSGVGARLREELSEAELRVMRYLPSNLKAPEIAAELYVSANTVRTHLRHIYAKLDAHSRGEAVARARELGLVAPGARRRVGSAR